MIALAFCYTNNPSIGIKNDSVAFLVFSYPNSTDSYFYLNRFLYNYTSNNNININLTKEVRIENNIFGYIFSGIEVYDLFNCDNLNFYSSINDKTIMKNYTLGKNETIKLDIVLNNISNFNNFTCILKYRYKITEPNLTQYDKCTYDINNNFESNYNETLEKEEYIGRLTYYNIILNATLTDNCNNTSCALCFMKNVSYCIICKYNYTYFEDGTKNCSYEDILTESYTSIITSSLNNKDYIPFDIDINNLENNDNIIKIGDIEIIQKYPMETKEELVEILPNLIDTIDINKNYQMVGKDFTTTIKPTDLNIPNTSFIDFSSCEKILRNHYNISEDRIIKILQLEIMNDDDSSLINNIGYQAYDDNKNVLNLSLCNDTNIKIFYLIKSNSSINISFISSFRDLNYDLLNINDSFFKDICISYSDKKNDVVLKDRVTDFYQNYSVCDEGCSYNESNLELMIITCDCKVKENLTSNISSLDLIKKDDIKKSSIFEIAKCYKLFFSWENKINNIGFIIFSLLLLSHIPLIFLYFYKGLFSIKNYLSNEMIKYGYITNANNNIDLNGKKKTNSKKGKRKKGKKKLKKNLNHLNN